MSLPQSVLGQEVSGGVRRTVINATVISEVDLPLTVELVHIKSSKVDIVQHLQRYFAAGRLFEQTHYLPEVSPIPNDLFF